MDGCTCRRVQSHLEHLGRSLFKFLGVDTDLAAKPDSLVRSPRKNSIVYLVVVLPVSSLGQNRVGRHLVHQVQDGRHLALDVERGLLGGDKKVLKPVLVHRSLGKRLGHYGGLLPLDTVHELDNGVEETGKHALEHVLGACVAFEHILVQGVLPAQLVDLALEEGQEVRVVVLVAEVLLCLLPVVQLADDAIVRSLGWALVRGVAIVALDEPAGAGAGAVQG